MPAAAHSSAPATSSSGASQRRRRFHYAATTQGRIHAWDWQPFTDASQRYMRNHIELDTLEAMARFPRIGR